MKRGLKAQVLDLFAAQTQTNAPTAQPTPALAPAPPPLAKRLNRNALTVAAVIMGMTVIACLVVLRGDAQTPTSRLASDPAVAEPASPTFLDRPATRTARPKLSTVTNFDTSAMRAGTASVSSAPGLPQPLPGSSFTPTAISSNINGAATYASLATSASSNVQPRDQAFDAALKRSAIGGADERAGALDRGGASAPNSSSLAGDEARLIAYGDSMMRGATYPASAQTGPALASNPKRTFMQQAGDLGGRSVAARLESSGSPYTLRAGTVIPAILLTAINSDLPGDCMGQVSRDVYDSQTQRMLLIPKGSKLMCRYDDQVVAGQGRLLVAWTRLMLPDGRSMTLPGLALKDPQGQTGAKGDVDNHTRRVFGRALLLSAIGAGAQLSQPRQVTILAPPNTGQVMAGAVGQELSNVALEVLRRGMDQPPTITIPQGQTFNVFLNGDLVFDGTYSASR